MADFFNRTGLFRPLFGHRGGTAAPRPVNTSAPVLVLDDGEFTITPGTWSGTGTISLSYVRLRNGVPAGTVTSPFNKVEADEGATITVVETATDDNGSRGVVSNGIEVPFEAPVAAGEIADQNWSVSVAITPLNVAADFTGQGIAYTLAPGSAALPAGLSLSSGGLITGTPTAGTEQVAIVVRGTNTGGFADTEFGVTVTAVTSDLNGPVLSEDSGFFDITENGEFYDQREAA